MTSARAAALTALGLLAAAIALVVLLLPWDPAVAPWAPLDLATIAYFTDAQVSAIEAYVSAVWLPSFLAVIAGPLAAVLILAVRPLREWLVSLGPRQRPALQSLVVAVVLLTIVRMAALPAWIWTGIVRRNAGLLTSTWVAESWRWLAETTVYVALGSIAVAVALAICRRWPRRGWMAVTVAAMLIAAAVSTLAPLVQRVEGTSADPDLTARVLAIADQLGVQVASVTVIDVADRSPAINANVSGIGPTRTVTIYDTVAQEASPAQIDALVTHELIHVRNNDVVLGTIVAMLGAGAATALAMALILNSGARRGRGPDGRGDAAAVPVLIAVVLVAGLLGTVAGATISRQIERRTDIETVQATGDPEAYAELMVTLATTNKSTLEPARWRYALFFTHPTPLQRLASLSDR